MLTSGASSAVYGWLMLAGILLSLAFWWRLARRDARLLFIYLGALGGAFFGAKIAPSWFTMQDAQGFARWPSVQVEILFNLAALCAVLYLRKRRLLPNQHFHLYLIGYGVFRFFQEFLREEPRVFGGITGYQIASIGVVILGVVGFLRRQNCKETALRNAHGIAAAKGIAD